MARAYLTAVFAATLSFLPLAQQAAQEAAPLITATPTILVRSPEPAKLMKFYEALGFKKFRQAQSGERQSRKILLSFNRYIVSIVDVVYAGRSWMRLKRPE